MAVGIHPTASPSIVSDRISILSKITVRDLTMPADFSEEEARLKDGWYYWVNDSYSRLKRMSDEERSRQSPKRLAHLFQMEYYMTNPLGSYSLKRKADGSTP